ncbi:hypothetical protein [Paenibacillus odorifer]|uniref:hypothetical protein n=1 Tax=Paenibacillus odorifer TaxID=189426 RepID=UPI0015C2FD33|nr:hypothetical protein [Paenibacillus odorifer]
MSIVSPESERITNYHLITLLMRYAEHLDSDLITLLMRYTGYSDSDAAIRG